MLASDPARAVDGDTGVERRHDRREPLHERGTGAAAAMLSAASVNTAGTRRADQNGVWAGGAESADARGRGRPYTGEAEHRRRRGDERDGSEPSCWRRLTVVRARARAGSARSARGARAR